MDVGVGLWRRLSTKELMLLNYGLEKTLDSPLDCNEIQPVHSKGDQSWVFFGRNDAKAETPVLWPPHAKSWLIGKDWCWEGLGAGGEGDYTGWDGWMASPTRWTWVWVNSGSWWWTGRPGMLRFTGSQRVGHDWATELNELNWMGIKVISLIHVCLIIKWLILSSYTSFLSVKFLLVVLLLSSFPFPNWSMWLCITRLLFSPECTAIFFTCVFAFGSFLFFLGFLGGTGYECKGLILVECICQYLP